jgi:GC-rich sequence DNA-binding factor
MIKERRNAEDEDDLCTFMGIVRQPEEEEIDELGRVIPKPTPAFRRAVRLARRQRRHHNQPQKEFDEEEGNSTDSSLPPSDLQSYRSAMASLTERAGQVLSDVRAEEFRDPGKGRWSAWREQYSDSYVGAWGGLGVVSVWEFWVRLEIVGWDFIKVCLTFVLWYISEPTEHSSGAQNLGQFQMVRRPIRLLPTARRRAWLRRRSRGIYGFHCRHSKDL